MKRKKFLIVLIVFITIIYILDKTGLFNTISFLTNFVNNEKNIYTEGIFYLPISYDTAESENSIPAVNASSAVVIDFETGRILAGKNECVKASIASTTKILTAIVAIENTSLDDIVTISRNAAGTSGSVMNISTGEQYTMEELLYGLLLKSGNDASVAIAEYIGGNVKDFAELMNKKAYAIGAYNSHFVVPHGLDTEGHFSTAYDLALITAYALKNEIFSKIVSTKTITIKGKTFTNTNELLGSYEGLDGVKTGYTGQAGRCLVTTASRDGFRIICVVLGCANKSYRSNDSVKLLNYAFNNYYPRLLLKKGEVIYSSIVDKGIEKTVPVIVSENIKFPISTYEISNIKREIKVRETFSAPVKSGTYAGYVKIIHDNRIIAQSPLVTALSIEKKGVFDYLKESISIWLGFCNSYS